MSAITKQHIEWLIDHTFMYSVTYESVQLKLSLIEDYAIKFLPTFDKQKFNNYIQKKWTM